MSDKQWMSSWKRVSSGKVAGATRSLLWKLLHRRLPLLYYDYIRDFYMRTAQCLLCECGATESYHHLFSACYSVRETVWAATTQVLTALQLPHTLASDAAAQLLGATVDLPTDALSNTVWPDDDPPTEETKSRLLGNTWGELRAVAIQSVWYARNKILHSGPLHPVQRTLLLKHLFWAHLRKVAGGKVRPPRDAYVQPIVHAYNQSVWTKIGEVVIAELSLDSLHSSRPRRR